MKNRRKALITGGSRGLGYVLTEELLKDGWDVMINSRDAQQLLKSKNELDRFGKLIAISGDVRDEVHLHQIEDELSRNSWKLDLVVNNASSLGGSPLQPLLDISVNRLHEVFHTNAIAPISLLQKISRHLTPNAVVINLSSDAAIESYPTWGGYSGSKAAMDHMTRIMAKENPNIHFYSVDPGDMRTEMHQAAFVGEDISDRPLPKEFAVPAILRLLEIHPESGRYDFLTINNLGHAYAE